MVEMRSFQSPSVHLGRRKLSVLRLDTISLPRNLIKINRKEIVVMSGCLYSNATLPCVSRRGLGEKKTKTMWWGLGKDCSKN